MADTFKIELCGFPGVSRAVAVKSLAAAFQLDSGTARQFVDTAPCIVRSSVDAPTAKGYTLELLAIGADVKVIEESTGQWRAYSAPDLSIPDADAKSARTSKDADDGAPDPFVSGVRTTKANVFCPSCGHLQRETERCPNCGHWVSAEFAAVQEPPQWDADDEAELEASENTEESGELDVFASLRGDEPKALEKAESPRNGVTLIPRLGSATRRKKHQIQQYDPFSAQNGKWYLIALLILALIAAFIVLLSPGSGGDESGSGAGTAPPGLEIAPD